jgi:hypothetical protein
MSEREHEHDAEEQVEDLDVPESESEDVKGGSLNFQKFNPAGIKGELKINDGTSFKFNPGSTGIK